MIETVGPILDHTRPQLMLLPIAIKKTSLRCHHRSGQPFALLVQHHPTSSLNHRIVRRMTPITATADQTRSVPIPLRDPLSYTVIRRQYPLGGRLAYPATVLLSALSDHSSAPLDAWPVRTKLSLNHQRSQSFTAAPIDHTMNARLLQQHHTAAHLLGLQVTLP